jgi:eukaryotic-like serine/threonine-protein kinase
MSNTTVKTFTFGTRRIRVNNRLVITLTISVLFVLGFFTIRKIEHEVKSIARFSLEQSLRANAESMLQFLGSKKAEMTIISQNPELLDFASTVTEDFAVMNASDMERSVAFKNLSKRMANLIQKSDYIDFYLVNLEGVYVASSDAKYYRLQGPRLRDELTSVLDKGDVFVSLPVFAQKDKNDPDKVPLMFTARNLYKEGKLFARLALRLDPARHFSRVMKASRSGESGETYAINRDGMMISESRFLDGLKKGGLLDETDASAVLRVKVQTPKGSPTFMARNVLSESKDVLYPNINSNIDGYLDYRGAEVIGAWTFLSEYGFAITSEVDEKEAFSSLDIIRFNFRMMLGLAALFAIGLVIYSRMTVKMQEKFRDALKEARELGQYALHEKLGEGGMGIVYKATHKMMHRETALKLLKPDACTERDLKLFENEVQQTCKLTHPNTISIYDYGKTDDGTFYYVMEYLKGMELDDIVKRNGIIPANRAIYFLKQICGSLYEAHSAGLVHRDIKGQNVFITTRGGEQDIVKVLDFGLVREIADTDNSMIDNVSGTPKYMSPESVTRPREVDHRTDIYAVGILAFYMLTAEYPFTGSTPIAILMQHVNDNPPRVSSLNFKVSAELEAIVMKCLEKDPQDRFQTTKEMSDALDKCDEGSWRSGDAEQWWSKNNTLIEGSDSSIRIEHDIERTIQIELGD